MSQTRSLVLASLFLALALILPWLTMANPALGQALLPMHLPVFLAGFVLGPFWGSLVGLLAPLLRSGLFGTPPLIPVAMLMTLELAVYGLVSGLVAKGKLGHGPGLWLGLILAMVSGRIAWGIGAWVFYAFEGTAFNMSIFLNAILWSSFPGILLQLVVVPPLVMAIRKALT